MKKLASSFASFGAYRFPGQGPRDDDCCWLKTLIHMAHSLSQWCECYMACL